MGTLLAVIAVFIAGLGGIYWRWARRTDADIAHAAADKYQRLLKNEPEFVAGLDAARFEKAYRRVHFPRFPKYALAAVTLFLVSAPLTLGLLGALQYLGARAGLFGTPRGLADRFLVEGGRMRFIDDAPPEVAVYYLQSLGGFYYFFGLLLVWMLIVFLVMRRYHARRPGYLEEEIALEQER